MLQVAFLRSSLETPRLRIWGSGVRIPPGAPDNLLRLPCADTLHSVLPAIPFALINRVSGAPRNPLPVVGSGSRFSRADSEAISRIQSRMRYTLTASALPLLKPRLPVARNGAGTLILPHPSTAHQVVLSQRQTRTPQTVYRKRGQIVRVFGISCDFAVCCVVARCE